MIGRSCWGASAAGEATVAADGAGLADGAVAAGGIASAGGIGAAVGADVASETARGGCGGSARWQLSAPAIQARLSAQASRVGWDPFMSAREVYQKTKKVPDLFWNRFVCRPVAAVLVNAVKDRRVTPNQLTLASFLLGISSAGLLILLPGHVGLLGAVLVFQASYVLDCADGMLARWRGVASPAGHLLDFLMDELKAFALLAAAAVRLQFEHPGQSFWLIGLVGLVALASGIALTSFQRHPAIAAPLGSAVPSRSRLAWTTRVLEGGAKLLIHYPSYLLYVAISGHLELYVYPYVVVNALYAARTWLSVALRFGRVGA